MGSLTISASVPVSRAGWLGERADDADLKPICSRELHSMATFSGRAAIGEGQRSDTSEKGAGENFGETGSSEEELVGRGANSGNSERKFTEDELDRSEEETD
jgi:hypothetical protein